MLVTKESIPAVIPRIIVFDNFLNSTGGTCDWERAVLQVVHCTQARWFKTRRDQTNIHACLEDVGTLFIITAAIGELGWIFSRRDGQRRFISGIALPQNHQANIIGKESIQDRDEN